MNPGPGTTNEYFYCLQQIGRHEYTAMSELECISRGVPRGSEEGSRFSLSAIRDKDMPLSCVMVAVICIAALTARADSVYDLKFATSSTETQVVVPSVGQFQAQSLDAAFEAVRSGDSQAIAAAQTSLLSTARSVDVSAGPIPGDANLDNIVNFGDLIIVAQNYGSHNASWQTGDFSGDHVVGFADLIILAQDYGDVGLAAVASAPLPSVAWGGFLLMGGVAAWQRGRRTLASWRHF